MWITRLNTELKALKNKIKAGCWNFSTVTYGDQYLFTNDCALVLIPFLQDQIIKSGSIDPRDRTYFIR